MSRYCREGVVSSVPRVERRVIYDPGLAAVWALRPDQPSIPLVEDTLMTAPGTIQPDDHRKPRWASGDVRLVGVRDQPLNVAEVVLVRRDGRPPPGLAAPQKVHDGRWASQDIDGSS